MIVYNEKDMEALGLRLAKEAKPGQLIALVGDLGTGKTTLTKHIAKGLGVTEPITSPTFTLVHEFYSGSMPLYHFDVYRINDPEEMYELGYEDYFYGEGLCVVEWADMIENLLPSDTILIHLTYGKDEGERIVEISSKK